MLTIITGPPCAGKTTWVRQHAQAGDVIIDFDQLAAALGAPQYSYTYGDHIWHVTLAATLAATDAAIQRHHHGATIWIIDGTPGPRATQYHQAGATTITLTANPQELHARATADHRPPAWHTRIDAWRATEPPPARRTRW